MRYKKAQRTLKRKRALKSAKATIKQTRKIKRTATKKVRTTIKKVNKLRKTPKIKKVVERKLKRQIKKYSPIKNVKSTVKRKVRKAVKKALSPSKIEKISNLYQGIENTDISKATSKVLKEYIKEGAELINEAYPTMNRASRMAVNKALKRFNVSDIDGLLDLQLEGDKKINLIEKARLLESIISGDGVSSVSLIIRNMKTLRDYQTFMKGPTGRYMDDLTFEDYNKIVKVAGEVEKELGEYYNEQKGIHVMSTLYEYGDKLGYSTVGDIIKKVYRKNKSGSTPSQINSLVLDEIKKQLRR